MDSITVTYRKIADSAVKLNNLNGALLNFRENVSFEEQTGWFLAQTDTVKMETHAYIGANGNLFSVYFSELSSRWRTYLYLFFASMLKMISWNEI